MKLHYRELGEGMPLIILHGLFGSCGNWQTHAKKIAEYYRVILVDLRNHGHSDWSDAFSYDLMSEDVYELVSALKLEEIIIVGHSMGGKVAMRFAQQHEDLLEKLIVVDMGIKKYTMHHENILAAIHAVDLSNITVRSQAKKQMDPFIDSERIKQFLLKDLYWKEKGVLSWRMNVSVLESEMDEILEQIPPGEVSIPTLFIRGELSNYIPDEDIETIEEVFIDSEFTTINGAGHWVHAETPNEFSDALLSFCLR
jgi:pimeloyl-ACP methyl ester carboxylesterase